MVNYKDNKNKQYKKKWDYSLLHNDILIYDIWRDLKRRNIQKIYITTFCTKQQILPGILNPHSRDLFKFPFKSLGFYSDHGTLIDLPEMEGVVIAQGNNTSRSWDEYYICYRAFNHLMLTVELNARLTKYFDTTAGCSDTQQT